MDWQRPWTTTDEFWKQSTRALVQDEVWYCRKQADPDLDRSFEPSLQGITGLTSSLMSTTLKIDETAEDFPLVWFKWRTSFLIASSIGIRGLDLSKNLLPSWDVVSAITNELPRLQRLALKYASVGAPSQYSSTSPLRLTARAGSSQRPTSNERSVHSATFSSYN